MSSLAEVTHEAIKVLPLRVPRKPVDNLAEALCQWDACKAAEPAAAEAQDRYPFLI